MSSSLYADEPGIPVSSDPRFKLPKRFTELRPAQLLIAEQAAALLSSGTDIVLVEAKVGFGKSLFAELVRQLLQTRMVMVVPRIDLQRQFLESFPQSRLLQGRTNFPHGGVDGRRDFPRVTCADCKEMHFCKNTGCMYKEAKNDFMSASVGVTNVSYFMAAANYLNMFLPGNDKKPRPGQHPHHPRRHPPALERPRRGPPPIPPPQAPALTLTEKRWIWWPRGLNPWTVRTVIWKASRMQVA